MNWTAYYGIERPNTSEGLYRVFTLDGNLEILPLMQQVYLNLQEANLLQHNPLDQMHE